MRVHVYLSSRTAYTVTYKAGVHLNMFTAVSEWPTLALHSLWG